MGTEKICLFYDVFKSIWYYASVSTRLLLNVNIKQQKRINSLDMKLKQYIKYLLNLAKIFYIVS